jgi:hypothetical protein
LEVGPGGDGLYREILRDETVLRLRELGKVRFLLCLLIDCSVTGSWDIQSLIRFTSSRYGNLLSFRFPGSAAVGT